MSDTEELVPDSDGITTLPEGSHFRDYLYDDGERVRIGSEGEIWVAKYNSDMGVCTLMKEAWLDGSNAFRKSRNKLEAGGSGAVSSPDRTAAPLQEDEMAKKATKKATKATKKKTTTKKATAKKAATKKATQAATNGGDRRERGALESDVRAVVEDFEAGKVEVPEGKTLTPHVIAKEIAGRNGADKPPSTGAVTNIVKKFDDAGFVLTHPKPYAVKGLSARGRKEGYDTLIEKYAEKRKADRKKS